MSFRLPLVVLSFVLGCIRAATPPATTPPAAAVATAKSSMVTIVSLALDRTSATVQNSNDKGVASPGAVAYPVKAGKVDLKDWQAGDFATISYEAPASGDPTLTAIAARTVTISSKVKIKNIADDRSEMIVWQRKDDGSADKGDTITLTVTGQALKDSLKDWKPNDLASVSYTRTKSGATNALSLVDITGLSAKAVNAKGFRQEIFWIAVAVGLLVWIWQSKALVGEDKRYSNSKMQMALWFSIVIAAYVASVLIRGFDYGSLNIPTNLLLLSGMSAITFGGAKAITENKVRVSEQAVASSAQSMKAKTEAATGAGAAVVQAEKTATEQANAAAAAVKRGDTDQAKTEAEKAAAEQARALAMKAAAERVKAEAEKAAAEHAEVVRANSVRTPAAAPSLVSDLVTDAEGKADLGDIQMTIITIIAAAVYIAQLQGFFETIELRSMVSLPDVDNTLLASFGLGHGSYLIKKAVGNINQ